MGGYYAYSVDSDFTIPRDKVAAALAAVNRVLRAATNTEYRSLAEVFYEYTGFTDVGEDKDGGCTISSHQGQYYSRTEDLLKAVAPYAKEGSFVRFQGDDSLFGFRVVDGRLRGETGVVHWELDPEPLRTIQDILKQHWGYSVPLDTV